MQARWMFNSLLDDESKPNTAIFKKRSEIKEITFNNDVYIFDSECVSLLNDFESKSYGAKLAHITLIIRSLKKMKEWRPNDSRISKKLLNALDDFVSADIPLSPQYRSLYKEAINLINPPEKQKYIQRRIVNSEYWQIRTAFSSDVERNQIKLCLIERYKGCKGFGQGSDIRRGEKLINKIVAEGLQDIFKHSKRYVVELG